VAMGIRETGTPGDVRTQAFIESYIRAIGWTVREQVFPIPRGGTSKNIIGLPPGFDGHKPYVIFGGHYDSLRGPGANDNGTGITASMEIARALAVRPAPVQTMFVGIGAEEVEPDAHHSHHVGSKAFVAAMSDEARRNLVAMVNIDMIGWGTIVHCPRLPTGITEGAERCVRIGRRLGFDARPEVQ